MAAKRKLISLREYAQHRGVTVEAVSKAVKTGRISLVGKKVDAFAADRDWAANTQPGQMAAKLARLAASRGSKRTRKVSKAQAPAVDPDPNSYASARARREDFLARTAQLEFEERTANLINAAEAKAAWLKLVTECKTRLLSVPIKCRGRIPGLSVMDVSIIENLIREELEELIDGNG
jgi:hypothetical protein